MKRFAWALFAVLFALLQVPAPEAGAQEPSGPHPLHLTLTRRPPVLHPAPDPKTAEKDADQAMTEIQARARRDELIRKLTEGGSRRPDLDRDVMSGIQSRAVTDALRRR